MSTQLSRADRHADLFSELASTVADGAGAAEVTLWVGADEELVAVASWPPNDTGPQLVTAPTNLASLGDGGRTHVRPIVHQGSLRGAVTLSKPPGEVLTSSDDRLLHDLAAQAGLVIDNAGLGLELQHRLHEISLQAAELQAAGKRIVAAQYEARRRIERDLHDGAQQRLVTLALTLQSLSQRAASAADDRLATNVEEARAQLSQALAELREMARGIHPAILTQDGLAAALGFLAERAALPVQLDVCLQRRLAQDVEATAYFVVSEALTNAAKHSDATSIAVVARLRDGRLCIDVTDNGQGGADGHWGSGLQGLREPPRDAERTTDGEQSSRWRHPAGGGDPVRVMLADDALLFREGTARVLIDAGFEVTGQAGDAAELLDLVRRDPPAAAIIDIRMPPGHCAEGLEAAVEIRRIAPQVGLLLLSQHVETHHAMRLMTEFDGGVGYLLKDRVSGPGHVCQRRAARRQRRLRDRCRAGRETGRQKARRRPTRRADRARAYCPRAHGTGSFQQRPVRGTVPQRQDHRGPRPQHLHEAEPLRRCR